MCGGGRQLTHLCRRHNNRAAHQHGPISNCCKSCQHNLSIALSSTLALPLLCEPAASTCHNLCTCLDPSQQHSPLPARPGCSVHTTGEAPFRACVSSPALLLDPCLPLWVPSSLEFDKFIMTRMILSILFQNRAPPLGGSSARHGWQGTTSHHTIEVLSSNSTSMDCWREEMQTTTGTQAYVFSQCGTSSRPYYLYHWSACRRNLTINC